MFKVDVILRNSVIRTIAINPAYIVSITPRCFMNMETEVEFQDGSTITMIAGDDYETKLGTDELISQLDEYELSRKK